MRLNYRPDDWNECSRIIPATVVLFFATFSSSGIVEAKAGQCLSKWSVRLKDRDPKKRIEAAARLARMGPLAEGQISSLIMATADDNVYVRRMAVYALGKIGSSAKCAKSTLVSLLYDKDQPLRAYAAFALDETGEDKCDQVLPVLIESLGNLNREVQLHAAYLIGKRGTSAKEVVPGLIELSESTGGLRFGTGWFRLTPARSAEEEREPIALDPDVDLLKGARKMAIWALGETGWGSKAAISALASLILDSDDECRNAAIKSLEKVTAAKPNK